MRNWIVFGIVFGMCLTCVGQVEARKKSVSKKTTTTAKKSETTTNKSETAPKQNVSGEEIKIEAEDFSGQGGGEVKIEENKVGASKKTIGNWNNAGQWVEWKFSIPKTGLYTITLQYATPEDACRSLIIDGAYPTADLERIFFKVTGGWGYQATEWQPWIVLNPDGQTPLKFNIKAGEHVLKLQQVYSPGLNLDYIVIKKVE
ncbi:MAG: hypothetical protein PHE88_10350 [Elusimicrobia bacterium]|nr:hypothetical protein [Elusimicrobiota bacterium]